MKVYIYRGGYNTVRKSGVGSAMVHQEQMLKRAGIESVDSMTEADVVHINTVFPDAVCAALRAKRMGKRVVYYGHSTEQDFRNSFVCSNAAAPAFRRWITFCYSLGDIIITPTDYSGELLASYGIKRPIYTLSNGVDTEFFRRDEAAGRRFREWHHIEADRRVVISAGHLMERKGILDYIELAKSRPDILFYWFGGGNCALLTRKVKEAVADKPDNLIFAGYVTPEELREAYCGADAFVFLSHEETEGIVILEALACEIPVIVRDIPVYRGWLVDGINVHKANGVSECEHALKHIFADGNEAICRAGRELACDRGLERIAERYGKIISNLFSQTDELRPCTAADLLPDRL